MDQLIFIATLILALIPAFIFIVNRRYFYYSIIVLYPLIGQSIRAKVTLFGFNLNPSMFFGFIVLGLISIDFITKPTKNRSIEIAIALFIIYAIIISFFSPTRFESLSWTMKIATWLFVLFSAAKTFNSEKHLIQIHKAVLIGCIIILLSFVLSRIGLYGTTLQYETGVVLYGGGFSSGKIYAYYLAMAIPILALGIYNKRSKTISYTLIILNIVVIILTFVRAPILALLVAYFAYRFFSVKFLKKSSMLSLVAVFFMCIFIISIYYVFHESQYLSRWTEMQSGGAQSKIEKLGSGRIGFLMDFANYYFYKATLVEKIFGTGLGSSSRVLNFNNIIHNDFAEILMGCGIIGISLYIYIIYSILKILLVLANRIKAPDFKMYLVLVISNYFMFLVFNMTNVSSSIVILIPWAIFTGAVIGTGQALLAENTRIN